jgi:hypothetical protein
MLALAVAALLPWGAAHAQVQSQDQQKCINKMNKDGIKVEAAQGKENTECVKKKANNELPGVTDAEDCLTTDPRGKVLNRTNKTSTDETTFCTLDVPDFGYVSAGTVNAAAKQAELDLIHDVFGPAPVDNGLFESDPNVPEAVCQRNAIDRVEKLMQSMGREFVKCKKNALKIDKEPFPLGADDAGDLEHCVNDAAAPNSVAADTKGKLAKRKQNLLDTIVEKCDMPSVSTTSFPGACTGLSDTTLQTCLIDLVECRLCEMINGMDGLAVDCDAFMNLVASQLVSCP